MSRNHRNTLAALLAGSALMLLADAASAQTSVSRGNWRQLGRGSSLDESRNASPQSFAFEIRFGPYYPQVDEEFGGAGPYSQVFGDDPQFYFGLEVDWLPLRIPWVAAIGPGFGWGYTRTSALAKLTADPTTESGAETSLTIMPMHLSAVARFDEVMRRTGIPVVPYLKLGIGLGTWSAALSGETVTHDGVSSEDTTWGTHLAVGVMLALNFLDRRSSAQLDESTGVNHAYLFGEWMNANLDGIGSRPQMHIGSSSWVLGLAFDM